MILDRSGQTHEEMIQAYQKSFSLFDELDNEDDSKLIKDY